MEQKPTKLNAVVDRLMISLGMGKAYQGWRIVEKWPEIVGADIAKVARAERFSDGMLTVVVEKDAWRQELEMQLEQILTKIRSLPGGRAVDKIILRAGSTREYRDGR